MLNEIRPHGRMGRNGNRITVTSCKVIPAAILSILLALLPSACDGYTFKKSVRDPRFHAPAMFEVTRDGRGISIYGRFGKDTARQLRRLLKKHPDIEFLLFTSPGGLLRIAHGIGRMVRKYALDTYAKTACYSACTIAFVYGERRAMVRGTRVLFHRISVERGSRIDAIEAKLGLSEYNAARLFRRQGVTEAFSERMFAMPRDNEWLPGYRELNKAGFVHRWLDGGFFAY